MFFLQKIKGKLYIFENNIYYKYIEENKKKWQKLK